DETVVVAEVVGVGERVVRHQLQTMREALVDLDLQRVVVAARVVAEEVAHDLVVVAANDIGCDAGDRISIWNAEMVVERPALVTLYVRDEGSSTATTSRND